MFTAEKPPYAENALEPVISKETIDFHYGKHHQAYVTKLNQLIEGKPEQNKSLEEIVKNSSGTLFNQAAQTWNHNFLWKSMRPKNENSPIPSELNTALSKSFPSLSDFQEAWIKEGVAHFASGWLWLVQNSKNEIQIISTHDAETPIRNGLKPLITMDLWEHAYYIDYRNDRKKFLESTWDLLNWNFALKNFVSNVY